VQGKVAGASKHAPGSERLQGVVGGVTQGIQGQYNISWAISLRSAQA